MHLFRSIGLRMLINLGSRFFYNPSTQRSIEFASLIDIHLLLTAYFVHFSYCNLHLKFMLGMGMAEFQLKDH